MATKRKIRTADLPLPKKGSGRPPGPAEELTRLLVTLEVGGCVLVADLERYDNARASASYWGTRLGRKFSTRLLSEAKGGGFGIWRVA